MVSTSVSLAPEASRGLGLAPENKESRPGSGEHKCFAGRSAKNAVARGESTHFPSTHAWVAGFGCGWAWALGCCSWACRRGVRGGAGWRCGGVGVAWWLCGLGCVKCCFGVSAVLLLFSSCLLPVGRGPLGGWSLCRFFAVLAPAWSAASRVCVGCFSRCFLGSWFLSVFGFFGFWSSGTPSHFDEPSI